jgi:hypothetical protein
MFGVRRPFWWETGFSGLTSMGHEKVLPVLRGAKYPREEQNSAWIQRGAWWGTAESLVRHWWSREQGVALKWGQVVEGTVLQAQALKFWRTQETLRAWQWWLWGFCSQVLGPSVLIHKLIRQEHTTRSPWNTELISYVFHHLKKAPPAHPSLSAEHFWGKALLVTTQTIQNVSSEQAIKNNFQWYVNHDFCGI